MSYNHKSRLIGGGEVTYVTVPAIRGGLAIDDYIVTGTQGTTLNIALYRGVDVQQISVIFDSSVVQSILADIAAAGAQQVGATLQPIIGARIDDGRIMIYARDAAITRIDVLAGSANIPLGLFPAPHPKGVSEYGQVSVANSSESERAFSSGAFLLKHGDRTSSSINRGLVALSQNVDEVEARTRLANHTITHVPVTTSARIVEVGTPSVLLESSPLIDARDVLPGYTLDTEHPDNVIAEAAKLRMSITPLQDGASELPLIGFCDEFGRNVPHKASNVPTAHAPRMLRAYITYGADLPDGIENISDTRDGTVITRSTWQRADFLGTLAGPTLPPPDGSKSFSAVVLDQYTIRLRGTSIDYGSLVRRGDIALCERGIFEVDAVCVDDATITLIPFSRSVQRFLLLPPDAHVTTPQVLGQPQSFLNSLQFFIGVHKTDAIRYFLMADRELDAYTHAWLRVPSREAHVHALSDRNERAELQLMSRALDPYAENPAQTHTHDMRALYASGSSKVREYVRELKTDQGRWLPGSRYEAMRSTQSLHLAPQAQHPHPLSSVRGRTRYVTQVLPLLSKFVYGGDGSRHSVANALYDIFERAIEPDAQTLSDLNAYLENIAQGVVTTELVGKVARGDVVSAEDHDNVVQLYEATVASLGLSRVHSDSVIASEDTFTLEDTNAEFSEHDVGRAFVYTSGTRTYTVEMVGWASPKTARFSSVDDADAHTGASTGLISRTLGVDFGTRGGLTQAHAPRRRDNALADDVRNDYGVARVKEHVAEHVNDVELRYLEMPRLQTSLRPVFGGLHALTTNAFLGTAERDISGSSILAQDPLALSDSPIFGGAILTTLRDLIFMLRSYGYLATDYVTDTDALSNLEHGGDPSAVDTAWCFGAIQEQRAPTLTDIIEAIELLERMGYVVSSPELATLFGIDNVGDVINSSDLDADRIPDAALKQAVAPKEDDSYVTILVTKRTFFAADLWFRLHNIEASLGASAATQIDAPSILGGDPSEPVFSTEQRIRVSARSLYVKTSPPVTVGVRSDIATQSNVAPLRALHLALTAQQVTELGQASHAYHLAARADNGTVIDAAVFYQGQAIHRILALGYGALDLTDLTSLLPSGEAMWSTTSVQGVTVPVHATYGAFDYGLTSAVARGTHTLEYELLDGSIVLFPQRPLVSTIPFPYVTSTMQASIISSGQDADFMVHEMLGAAATLFADAHAAIAEQEVSRGVRQVIHATPDNTRSTEIINSITQDAPTAAVRYTLETEGRIPTAYAPRSAYLDGFKPKYDRVLDVTVDVGACAVSATSTGYSSLESATYALLTDTDNDGIYTGSLKNGPATVRVVSGGAYDVISGQDDLTGFISPRGASPYGKNGPAAPAQLGISDRWTGEPDIPISARDGIQVQTSGTGLRVTTAVTHLPDGSPALFKGYANLDAHPVPASIVTEGGHDVAVLDDTPSENKGYPYPALRALGGVRVHGALRLDGDIPSTFYASHNIVPGQDLLSGVSGHINPVESSRHSGEYTTGTALTQGLSIGSDAALYANDLYVHSASSVIEDLLGARASNTHKTRVPQLGERVNAVEFDFSALDLASETWTKDEYNVVNHWDALPCVYFGARPDHMALLRVFIGPDAIVLALSAPGIALGSASVGRTAVLNISSETALLQRGNISCTILDINREIVPGVCLVTLQGAPTRFDHGAQLNGFTIADQLGGLAALPALASSIGAHYVALDNPGLVYVAAAVNMGQHIETPTNEGSGSVLRVSGVIHGREWSLNAYQIALSDRMWVRNDRGANIGKIYGGRDNRLHITGNTTFADNVDVEGTLTVNGNPVALQDTTREYVMHGAITIAAPRNVQRKSHGIHVRLTHGNAVSEQGDELIVNLHSTTEPYADVTSTATDCIVPLVLRRGHSAIFDIVDAALDAADTPEDATAQALAELSSTPISVLVTEVASSTARAATVAVTGGLSAIVGALVASRQTIQEAVFPLILRGAPIRAYGGVLVRSTQLGQYEYVGGISADLALAYSAATSTGTISTYVDNVASALPDAIDSVGIGAVVDTYARGETTVASNEGWTLISHPLESASTEIDLLQTALADIHATVVDTRVVVVGADISMVHVQHSFVADNRKIDVGVPQGYTATRPISAGIVAQANVSPTETFIGVPHVVQPCVVMDFARELRSSRYLSAPTFLEVDTMDTSAAYYPDSGLSLAQVPNESDMPYLPGSEDGTEIKLLHQTNGGDYILNTSYAVTQGYSVDVLRKIASLGFRLDRTHLEEWLTLAQYEHDTSHDVKGVYQLTLDFSLRIKMRD